MIPATAEINPTDWPVPEGWKTETIPFPLEFAPEIKHVGTEELRFAPGMFKPDQPGYWSYGFVWWVEEKEFQGPDDLAVELRDYFRGLLVAVAKEKKLALDPEKIIVSVRALRMKDHEGWRPMAGEAEIFDAFGDGRPLKLTLWVYQRDYAEQGRRAVLVLASPAPAGAPIWKDLNDLRDSFPR